MLAYCHWIVTSPAPGATKETAWSTVNGMRQRARLQPQIVWLVARRSLVRELGNLRKPLRGKERADPSIWERPQHHGP